MQINGRTIIVFDIEVFKEDFLFVAYHTERSSYVIIHNDPSKMREFHEKYKNDIWVSYNGRTYDIPVIQIYMSHTDQETAMSFTKEVSDKIINSHGKEDRYRPPSDLMKQWPIINYDCMIDVQARSYAFGVSLKKLEGYLGYQIEETTVGFDIDRKLTEKELEEVIHYCKWDVKCTWRVFQEIDNLSGDFKAQVGLVELFNLSYLSLNRTKAQISASILEAVQPEIPRDDEFLYTFPDTLKLDKYQYIADWYNNPENKRYDAKLITDVAGIKHVYAFGGLHAAKPNYRGEGNFLMCDVGSYYPSMMVEYGFLSRNVIDPEKFKEIKNLRLKYKKEHDPLANSLKIVINATFGASKDQYNGLYDPLQANNVCIGGQLLLTDLIEKIEDISTLIQSNTDGVLVKYEKSNEDELIDLCHEWEKRTRMDLSFDTYKKVIQRDVNNYIIVDEKGHIKSKGTDVKERTPIDYECAVIGKAMQEYFINGTPVDKTIWNDDNYMDYMMIVKRSVKYDILVHYEDRQPVILPNATNRVFASADMSDGALCKGKYWQQEKKTQSFLGDFGISVNTQPKTWNEYSIGKLPSKVFIDNGTILEKDIPEKLDKNWYVFETERRIKQWGIPYET